MKARLLILIFFIQTALYSQKLEIVQPVRYLAPGDSYTTGTAVDNEGFYLFELITETGRYVSRMIVI